jgi:predicted Zn-dependent protease with MMP-like domain
MTERSLSGLSAPSLQDIERLAAEAFSGLPAKFRDMCGEILFRVEDFPADEVVEELGVETPFDILGLFHGVGLAQDAALPQTGQMPNRVFLYRRPILDYWAEHVETLGTIVAHVLIHEIGHHFGMSDADMEALEAASN